MPAKYIRKRPGSSLWQLRVPVPSDVQKAYGRRVVTKSLGEEDELAAAARAMPIVRALKAEWADLRVGIAPSSPVQVTPNSPAQTLSQDVRLDIVRTTFKHVLEETAARRAEAFAGDQRAYEEGMEERLAEHRRFSQEANFGILDRYIEPAARMVANRGVVVDRDAAWFPKIVHDVAVTMLDARGVSNRIDLGEVDPQPTSTVVQMAFRGRPTVTHPQDMPFSELAENFMCFWLADRSSEKKTNTEQQKRATFRLFGSYFENRPIRMVGDADAAAFSDELRKFDPHWARSPASRKLSWSQLVDRYGGRTRGLSDGTMNRHLQVLQELWAWARKRRHCEGENPFDGFHKKLRPGINVRPYIAWEDAELRQLLSPPPKRSDLLEVILVGMFTGMRLDEVASLTWGQVRTAIEADVTIPYFQVEDAKTPAGNRKVPLHHELDWLLARLRGSDGDRLWPNFNEEGRGKKPGADAGREFSRFKKSRGFEDRTKTFHSFRKNVTRMMERAQVPENDWAQIFGHERGFTYKVYNPDGIDMRRRAEIINLIRYPNIAIPHPKH